MSHSLLPPSVEITAANWATTGDPVSLLEHRFGMRSPDSTVTDTRQVRLYFLACARRAWDQLPWSCRTLVEVAERLADGKPVDQLLRSAAQAAAEELVNNTDGPDARSEAENLLEMAGLNRPECDCAADREPNPKTWPGLAHLVYYGFRPESLIIGRVPASLHAVELIREVFGNPFRTGWFDPRWRTNPVREMARGMYRAGTFAGMPLLADALQDAGCADAEILDHCRSGAGHVRGCWVLDGLLSPADRK